MKLKKLLLSTAVLGAISVMYGCTTEGDDAVINIESTTTSGGSDSTISQNCPEWSSAREMSGDTDVCQIPSEILEDQTLDSDRIWYMSSRVTVGNGNGEMSATEGTLESGEAVLDVTLSIESGTQILARSGSFANLLITRGSKLEAIGTAEEPIVFSSDDEGEDGAGEWGGLILHGYAPHNVCGTDNSVSCNVDAEGESGFAGGYTADDSSGRLSYVVVTEGGYEFATGNEINGISFVGVGSDTTVDHIQVNGNADDGVEFYGGTVNASYLVLTGNQDDSVDWDEGYQGNLQYVIVKQTADVAGNAIEADTEGSLDFYSKPTIANATFIGHGSKDTLLVFKKNSGGFLHHSVLTSDADSVITTCVDSSDTDQVTTTLVFNEVVADCTISGDTNLIPAPITDVALDANYAAQATEASSLTALDIAGFNVANTLSVADEDFFDATTYAGAIDPAATEFWFSDWTVEDSL